MPYAIKHYGTPRHSGRYEWGSGENPKQRDPDFLGRVAALRKQGLSDSEIAKGEGMKRIQLTARRSAMNAEQRKADVTEAIKLKDKGYSNVEIGKRMGKNESSVRALLNPAIQERSEIANVTSNMLKDSIAKKKYIDVGVGVERHMGINRTKLQNSVAMLEEEGYKVHRFSIDQIGTGKKTNMIVITKDDLTYKESYKELMLNKDKITLPTDYSEDGGRTFEPVVPPRSVSSDRIQIRYGKDDGTGGSEKDGVIELRRGVDDISLGASKYAQVRIGVDGTHYLKGMAMYTDDLPKGVDIIYNTNKPEGTPKEKVFKEMKTDINGVVYDDNPFGATVRQKHYKDKDGKEQLSSLNIVNEEGEWRDKWSKSLSSQMLSKQAPALAKKQLELAFNIKKEEFDDILALNNPGVKKKLLDSFADDVDSSAVHLKSAAMPRTGWHVLLPFNTVKENEIYAPNFNDGERVVLIRYPHGGIFEIPELTVNNRNPEAKKILSDRIGTAKDAVGIHAKVAERLSGADFDGDAVLVIPNNQGAIKTSAPLKGLLNFDPKINYKPYDGMRTIDGGIYNAKTDKVDYGDKKPITRTKQMKMGDVSNLITDMTIKGANPNEIARAVRHSMVVIDSEKHHLNYVQSHDDNGIGELKKKYQGSARSGASTLISRASSDKRPGTRREKTDPITGRKVYEYKEQSYINKKGKTVTRTTPSTKMAETDDAFTLSSGTAMETVYASHANKLKALANQARKVSVNTRPLVSSPSAKKVYEPEVSSLMSKLNIALKNSPLERKAHLLAGSMIAAKKSDNPGMDNDDLKKIKGQALATARVRVGAKKDPIEISDKEWAAIQAGAISANTLSKILNNTNLDKVKQLATPRTTKVLNASKIATAKSMLAKGYTQAEVAAHLGVSTSSIGNLFQD